MKTTHSKNFRAVLVSAVLALIAGAATAAPSYSIHIPAVGLKAATTATPSSDAPATEAPSTGPSGSQTFDYSGTIQTWTAPKTGTYVFDVYGAQAGYPSLYQSFGPFGAYIQCSVSLTAGAQLKILAGGAGQNSGGHGGAGGGTFVATAGGVAIAVAGGGGGGWSYHGGGPGHVANNGTANGALGAGFSGNGTGGAMSFLNGGAAASGGGFGGGGGYGSGGGGYNGGGVHPNDPNVGDGGGSYCSGTLVKGQDGAWGVKTGGAQANGRVVVNY